MPSRREFLGAMALPALGSLAPAAAPRLMARAAAAVRELPGRDGSPEEIARDESYWFPVQQIFAVDRSLVNLNNGGVSPSPAPVLEAMKRDLDFSNQAPAYTMWRILEPNKERVRDQLARLFGCSPEETAIVRNASEGLQICQFGFDLEPGDRIVTTNQDYPRMITTWQQRERREGVVLDQVSIPTPCEDPARIVRAFEEAITPRTRLLHMCHVINLTGQILPVRDVVRMARERGIPVIVDGAHSFAQFPFRRDELECDYYATSLHKWLFAPHGTGMLYVRRERIPELWPLMAARKEMRDDIRKYEEIGTHPLANFLAISDAVAFHEGIGPERKAARMRYLFRYWADRLRRHDRIRLHTSLDPRYSCGIGLVEIDGLEPAAVQRYLMGEHRILTISIEHAEFRGLRISPSVYTTLPELDSFCDAMERVVRDGLPG